MSMRYPGGFIASTPVTAAYPSGVWTQAQAIPYQAQNVWTRDQYWPYTTLLLQGNGTNGAQNNTFLDSSTNNFTITRNGNTTQGAFTPYEQDGYWSNYFDGSSILTFASSTNYVPGSGQFCLECWFFPTTTSGDRWMIGNRNGNYVPFAINYQATTSPGSLVLYISSNGSSWDVVNNAIVSGVSANQWNHFALVRNSSNQFIVYINGLGTTIATNAANFTSAQPFYVGGSPSAGDADFIGYISNVRFVKGDSVYSGNFIPSAAPLTAITNTQLLTSQSNRFIDKSTNAVTPTLTGTPSVQAFQPFPGATTWSASVLGGSGYFDGSGDYLTAPNNTALDLSTGDFTVEVWFYPTVGSQSTAIVNRHNGNFASGNDFQYGINLSSGSLVVRPYQGTTDYTTTVGATQTNAWNHAALVRTGNTFYGFLNGVRGATSQTISGALNNSTWATYLGASLSSTLGNAFFTGYMGGVRITKGGALYTGSTYTVPTVPLTTTVSSGTVSLLTNFTNAGIYDNSMMNNLETVGNAQVSTSVVKYGTGSMAFDGNGDYLYLNNTRLLTFNGSSTFTVEGWFYQTASVSASGYMNNVIGDLTPTAATALYWSIGMNASNQPGVRWYDGAVKTADSSTALVLNTWNHVAWVVTAGVVRIFINGVQATLSGTTTLTTPSTTLGYLIIGADRGYYMTGYMDDLRISAGVARYITNFTPPPARMPGQ